MTHKPSVGDKYKCTCDDHKPLRRGDIVTVEHVRTYIREDLHVEFEGGWVWRASEYPTDFKYVEPEKQLPFKGICFINVKSYAEKSGILMDKAHEEIQTKLFSMGYTWGNKSVNVSRTHALYLYIYEHLKEIYYSMDYDEEHSVPMIDINRNVTVNLEIIFPKKIEYIMLNGKRYEKEKLEQALKMIEEGKL